MGSGFSSLNQNVFGFTALVVSLVALFTTVLQVLQQYFSSAEGHRRCAASVMGPWSQGTHRKLRWREFRIEVVFETPVIFVAAPTNLRGPITGRPIHYIDGTDESYHNTQVLGPDAQARVARDLRGRVHTADDEKASWVTLLATLQDKEERSRKWDEQKRFQTPNSIEAPEHELAIGLQVKTRSWDFIPSSITKPYATSAICHLVEMMAMLGLYWKSFDQSSWNLRAEGNGFILTSTSVHGLGVMVQFATTGKANFEESRVIPTHDIKELSFGSVPSIFDDGTYLEKETDTQSVELKFGSDEDVENTLEALGCQALALKRYRKDHKHIFSVSFEIIGMLAKVFRIRGSNFRMIPNPTADRWLKKIGAKASWKITRLMEIFQEKLAELIEIQGLPEKHQSRLIAKQWAVISKMGCADEVNLTTEVRETIHDILDETTEYLRSIVQLDLLNVVVTHITKVVEVLSNPTSALNIIVLANKERDLMSYYFKEIRPAVIDAGGASKKAERQEVWISLIFRMLCWLLLHDFDKSDAMIIPSDLKGSRMPVYIG